MRDLRISKSYIAGVGFGAAQSKTYHTYIYILQLLSYPRPIYTHLYIHIYSPVPTYIRLYTPIAPTVTMFLTYAMLFWYGSILIQRGEVTFKELMISILTLMLGALGMYIIHDYIHLLYR